jgi:hypothetical protein
LRDGFCSLLDDLVLISPATLTVSGQASVIARPSASSSIESGARSCSPGFPRLVTQLALNRELREYSALQKPTATTISASHAQ